MSTKALLPRCPLTLLGSAVSLTALCACLAACDTGQLASPADAGAEATCAVDRGPLDDAEVALGRELVEERNCQQCHGGSMSGNFDGVQSTTVKGGTAYPPNLTSDLATGLGCWSNEQIANAIVHGIDNEGAKLCAPMPVFGDLDDGGLDPAQARAVVQFLRSLPPAFLQVPSTPDCPGPETAADAEADAG